MEYTLDSHELFHEIEIKKSRFLTHLFRVDSEEEARTFIHLITDTYPDARHHCTAFIIATDGAYPLMHSSDNGEPAGTAGRPMLDVLTGLSLVNTLAVVTRYFGGTLLGSGGLVHAYSSSVSECLEGAKVCERRRIPQWKFLIPHAQAGKYMAFFTHAHWFPQVSYEGEGARFLIKTSEEAGEIIRSFSRGEIEGTPCGYAIAEVDSGVIQGGKIISTKP